MKNEVIAALGKIKEDIAREHGFDVKRLGAMLRERDRAYADRVVGWSHSKRGQSRALVKGRADGDRRPAAPHPRPDRLRSAGARHGEDPLPLRPQLDPHPNGPKDPRMHRDNSNNSLLPPCDDVRYGQISSWYFPEDVPEDRAPMMVIPKEFGDDAGKGVLLAVPGGTQMIFNNLPVALGHSVHGERGAALLGDPDLRPRRPLLGRGPQLHQLGVGSAVPGVHRLDQRRAGGDVPVSAGQALVLQRRDPGGAGGALPGVGCRGGVHVEGVSLEVQGGNGQG